MKKRTLKILMAPLILFLSFGLYAQEQTTYFDQVQNPDSYTAAELAEMDTNFSTFVNLLEMSGLDTQMEYNDAFTLLIPIDDAFGEMEREEFNELKDPNNRAKLQEFLRRHIIPEKVYLLDFNSDQIMETSDGKVVEIDADENLQLVYVGGAQIIASDIETSDGIIHVVDSVVSETDNVRN